MHAGRTRHRILCTSNNPVHTRLLLCITTRTAEIGDDGLVGESSRFLGPGSEEALSAEKAQTVLVAEFSESRWKRLGRLRNVCSSFRG